MFNNLKPKAPSQGYDLAKWKTTIGYRATALAYCKRYGVAWVENSNGYTYTRLELEQALVG